MQDAIDLLEVFTDTLVERIEIGVISDVEGEYLNRFRQAGSDASRQRKPFVVDSSERCLRPAPVRGAQPRTQCCFR